MVTAVYSMNSVFFKRGFEAQRLNGVLPCSTEHSFETKIWMTLQTTGGGLKGVRRVGVPQLTKSNNVPQYKLINLLIKKKIYIFRQRRFFFFIFFLLRLAPTRTKLRLMPNVIHSNTETLLSLGSCRFPARWRTKTATSRLS